MMHELSWPLIILALALLRGFFIAAENAAVQLEAALDRAAEDAPEENRQDPIQRYLRAIQNEIPISSPASMATLVLLMLFSYLLLERLLALQFTRPAPVALVVFLFVVAPLLLLLTEVLPRQIGRAGGERLLARMVVWINLLTWAVVPALIALHWISNLLVRPFGIERARVRKSFSREDLVEWVEDGEAEEQNQETEQETSGRKMISAILELHSTLVREVMKPLNEVTVIKLPARQSEVLALSALTGYSRIPVYPNRIIELTGYVSVPDLLRADEPERPLADFIREAYYVPETKPVDDLLREFLDRNITSAIVIDEYGACSGWITREDLLEEIVGEIADEFDREIPEIRELAPNCYRVPAGMDIDDLNDQLELELPHPNFETLGGFVYSQLGRVPRCGEILHFKNIELKVVEMQRLKIQTIELKILAAKSEA